MLRAQNNVVVTAAAAAAAVVVVQEVHVLNKLMVWQPVSPFIIVK